MTPKILCSSLVIARTKLSFCHTFPFDNNVHFTALIGSTKSRPRHDLNRTTGYVIRFMFTSIHMSFRSTGTKGKSSSNYCPWSDLRLNLWILFICFVPKDWTRMKKISRDEWFDAETKVQNLSFLVTKLGMIFSTTILTFLAPEENLAFSEHELSLGLDAPWIVQAILNIPFQHDPLSYSSQHANWWNGYLGHSSVSSTGSTYGQVKCLRTKISSSTWGTRQDEIAPFKELEYP